MYPVLSLVWQNAGKTATGHWNYLRFPERMGAKRVIGPAQAGVGDGLFPGNPRHALVAEVATGQGDGVRPPFKPGIEFP